MFSLRKKKINGDGYLTVMVIPEKSSRVQKLLIPFFVIKLGLVLFSVFTFFFIFVGLDYLNVLGQVAENKKLRGENFKLRQEMQQIKNKVDSMETTMDRVRTYAKKLQILTGQKDSDALELPQGGPDRGPASREFVPGNNPLLKDKKPVAPLNGFWELDQKVEGLNQLTSLTEESLSKLEIKFLAKHALLEATPSLIPIVGWISSAFGYRRNPYNGQFRLHAGVDLAAESGAPVRSPAPGVVLFSGYKEGYGKVVVMSHGYGISTVYAHLSRIFVNTGDRIRKTEILAEVGNTGHSTGPHLHYEIRKNGVPVNPVTFFSRSRF